MNIISFLYKPAKFSQNLSFLKIIKSFLLLSTFPKSALLVFGNLEVWFSVNPNSCISFFGYLGSSHPAG